MDTKLKEELLISMTDLRKKIKDKKITLKEVQTRVQTFNRIIFAQKLDKLALFYPKEESEFAMLGDHISAITLKGLAKL